MKFNEKLDLLMDITNTSNSNLARYISLDASYVSRLRSGARVFVRKETKEEYARSMADYFARHCPHSHQRQAIYALLEINPSSYDEDEIAESIYEWLMTDDDTYSATVGNFLDGSSNIKVSRKPPVLSHDEPVQAMLPKSDTSIFYGVDGKRQAAIEFLSEVIRHDQPQTLLLFSEEDIEWLVGDRAFVVKWAQLMTEAISRGNKIRIIHVVSRDLDEMLSAISQWLPLYMSGAIEPYFYPKKRDGVFRRTLFIAPETAAVVSSSVAPGNYESANFLFRDKQVIQTCVEEFNSYLKMCKPLMKIFTAKDREPYISTLLEFEREEANSIITTESISLLTMPEALVHALFGEFTHKERGWFLNQQRLRRENFYNQMQNYTFTEIIRLPHAESVKLGRVKIASSDMLSMYSSYYSPGQYVQHVRHIITLLETYPNFHVWIDPDPKEERPLVYAKEDVGVIVAKTSTPPIAMAINESNLTGAFWDYLRQTTGEKDHLRHEIKAETVDTLLRLIEEVEKSN